MRKVVLSTLDAWFAPHEEREVVAELDPCVFRGGAHPQSGHDSGGEILLYF